MLRLVALSASILLAVPVLALSADTVAADSVTAASRPPAIKVLSYNLRGPGAASKHRDKGYYAWEVRKSRQVKLVLDQNPAIFGLQEASTDTTVTPRVRAKDYLVPRYAKSGYAAYVPRGGAPKLIFWKSDRFVRIEAGNVKLGATTACGQDARSFAWVLLKEIATGQHYFIGNAHLATTSACLSTRVASAKKIHRTIASHNPKNHPVILMGDFNNRQRHCYPKDGVRLSEPIRRLAEPANKVHVYNLDVTSPSGCVRTTHGNWPRPVPAPGPSRIDFLFHTKKLTASDYRVIRTRNLAIRRSGQATGEFTSPSDHFPIVARFRLG